MFLMAYETDLGGDPQPRQVTPAGSLRLGQL